MDASRDTILRREKTQINDRPMGALPIAFPNLKRNSFIHSPLKGYGDCPVKAAVEKAVKEPSGK
jgi:hypothetical protein